MLVKVTCRLQRGVAGVEGCLYLQSIQVGVGFDMLQVARVMVVCA